AVVAAMPRAVRSAQCAEFDSDEGLRAPTLQRLAQQHLVLAGAIEVAAVEIIHACVERGMHGRDALAIIDRPVAAGEAHAPEADRRNRWAVAAELTLLH